MLPDVLLGRLKQLRHVLLREPDGFALEAHVDLQLTVRRLVNEELAAGHRRGLGFVAHGMGSNMGQAVTAGQVRAGR